jgi:hypothetical protein
MPLLISTNTCHFCTYASRFYSKIIDCGMVEIGMHMYSYRDMGVPKSKYLRSKTVRRALGVDKTLLKMSLAVVILTVGVLT